MSKQGIQQVIQKAVGDAAFRRQLQREPAKALAGFDLTADERASIAGGDPARLTALGVDQRMSKAFALGAAADASTGVSPVSGSTTGDMGTAGSASFLDEASSGATRGLVGDSASGATSGIIGDPAGATTDGIIPDPGTAGVSAFDDVDASGDANAFDAGMTGGLSDSITDDGSALTTQLDESSGLDTGGDIRPTEY